MMKNVSKNLVHSHDNAGMDVTGEHSLNPNSNGYRVKVKQAAMEMGELSKPINRKLSEMHVVIREGKLDIIERCISTGKKNKKLNDLDNVGLSALHHATRYNRTEAVQKLLEYGAKVDVCSREENNTPLHIASRFGWVETTKALLDHGANPKLQNTNGSTPLHFACRRGNKEVVALLLNSRKIDVNAKDKLLMTPLHIACIQGDSLLCTMLLEKGADPETEAIDKMTPLHSAVSAGNNAAAKAILGRALAVNSNIQSFVHARDVDSNSVLHLCAMTNNADVAETLLAHGADVNSRKTNFATPMHVASAKGSMQVAKILVAKGADIHAKDNEGRTPLHMAASFGQVEAIKFLLANGASVDERDYVSKTPFLAAAASGKTENALTLLANGADLSAYEVNMKNWVHLAVESENLETLKVILECPNCEKNLYNSDILERVPLHYAAMCQNIKILEAVLKKQTRFTFQDENQKTPLHLASEAGRAQHVEALGQAGLPINERDEEGRSALHFAAMKGNRKVCYQLLQLGADINSRDNNRWTPLMYASMAGTCKPCAELLDSNASIDDFNNSGDSALLVASRYNRVGVVRMLFDRGASVTHRNNSEMGVIETAVKWGAMDVVMAVCQHERWQEVLEDKGSEGHSPMKLLIRHCPEAAMVVMNRCVKREANMNTTDPDYQITYDFSLLDPGPDDPAFIRGNRYFGPETMVQFNRQSLLLHALTQQLLEKKWSSFGKFIYYFSFYIYLIFTICYTIFLVLERQFVDFEPRKVGNESAKAHSYFEGGSATSKALPYVILIFAVTQMLKEVIQMFIQRCTYFTQLSNVFEWGLYLTATIFMIPYCAPNNWIDEYFGSLNNPYYLWIIGLFSIFICYMNLVLFLRRFRTLGIYVTMFLEVLKSIIMVMMVFVIFILAFAIVFYIMFKEQAAFKTFGHSLLKVTIMMIGEIDYTDTFVTTVGQYSTTTKKLLNPFPETAYIFCVIFVFVLSIAMMNLLVGLAVGDIDTIQRDASLKRLAMQVNFVAQIETKYPRFITRMIYNPVLVVQPNKNTLSSRLWRLWGQTKELLPSVDTSAARFDSTEDLRNKLDKTKKRLKMLVSTMEAQGRLLKAMAKKIDPDLDDVSLANEVMIVPDMVLPDDQEPDEVDAGAENKAASSTAITVSL